MVRKYESISSFDWKCVEKCFNEILSKEISIINPKIIFTFGSSTYNNPFYLLRNSEHKKLVNKVVSLPIPQVKEEDLKYLLSSNIFQFNIESTSK